MVVVSVAPQTEIESSSRPQHELADLFRLYSEAFKRQYPLSSQQRLVMRDIVQCRTAVLGGHVDECDSCGGLRISYNSCRNRHCPKCGGLAKAEWLEKQKALLLPTHYFHVVFTIDHAFNPIARVNPKAVYDLLFHSAAATLKGFGQRYLGGEIGVTAVLHTWGQTLTEHLHLHCIVTGGALTAASRRWRSTAPDYLFPIVELSAQFRDRFCQGMERLYHDGRLGFHGQSEMWAAPAAFAELIQAARGKKWQVYAKPPFGSAAQALEYLGRYVQRIAISNHRILDIAADQVRFTYRDYQANGVQKELVLPAVEFMRRFLQHVLPKNFVRVRHYGLLAPRYRQQKLARCRALLGNWDERAATANGREALLRAMLGHDPERCPLCGVGSWRPYQTIEPHPSRRRWLLAVQ